MQRSAAGRSMGLVAAALLLALGARGAPAQEGSDPSCPDHLDLERYSGLSKTVRKKLGRGIELHERAQNSEDWDRLIVASRKLLQGAAKKSGECKLPHYYLGISFRDTMLFEDSERWLGRAVAENAAFHEAHTALATVKMIRKDLKGALAHSEKAVAACPGWYPAIEAKAESLIRLHRLKDAETFLATCEKPGEKNRAWRADFQELSTRLDRALTGPQWGSIQTVESENYKVLTSLSRRFAEAISQRAELIHKVYNRVFPEVEKPDRKYEIWVYGDEESYLADGGPANTLGYYDLLFRRLTLFRRDGDEATFEVLQHEAFHQYLHDYLEIAPAWFNEGFGDYFGAYEHYRKDGRDFMRARSSPLRAELARRIAASGFHPPISTLMRMSQKQLYDERFAGIYYAQAWSVIYFIVEGDARSVKLATSSRRKYVKTLQAYFKHLRAGKNIHQAYARTFGRVDMKKFEEEWRDFVANLPETR